MKTLVFLIFLCLFGLSVYGKESLLKAKTSLEKHDEKNNTDQSLKIITKSKNNKQSQTIKAKASTKKASTKKASAKKASAKKSSIKKSSIKKSSIKKSSTKKASTKKASNKKANQEKSSNVEQDLVAKKVEEVFIDFLEILDKESVDSRDYTRVVKFLENSLYNDASFETLKLLATTYREKKDFKNQIKVLNILSVNYSRKPESFYLLGMGYKDIYLNEEDNKEINKNKSIENFHQVFQIDRKYVLAYEALLSLLMTKNLETEEVIHTRESLSVVMDMLKIFKKNKYYIQLCKAYYDNKFFKQSRKACEKSIKKNPNDPISRLIFALSRENKKEADVELLKVARKFKKSFFIQYKTALFFMDKYPKVAITYFSSAHDLQPENIRLNEIMSKFFFDNKEEEKSYEYFLNICLLTDGKNLRKFRQAKSRLRRKKMQKLGLKFKKGIDKCFLKAKQKKKNKK